MTAALSASQQQEFVGGIDADIKAERRDVPIHAGVAVAGLIGFGVFLWLFPPLAAATAPGLPTLAAPLSGLLGLVGFNKFLKSRNYEKTLTGIKAEAGQEGFVDKLKARAARAKKTYLRSRNTFDALFLGSAALLFATVLTPLEIPLAVIAAGFAAAAVVSSVYIHAAGGHWAATGAAADVEKMVNPPAPKKRSWEGPQTPVPVPPAPKPAFDVAAVPAAETPAETKDLKPAPEASKPGAPPANLKPA
jgi:hypothetical protein